jgi:membrane protein implicated in regulation of membrane protease activity
MRTLPTSVHVVTSVLLVNMLVATLDLPLWVYFMLFAAAPFLMAWMVWTVLQDRSLPMKDLGKEQEWGYQDRSDLHT